MKQNGPSGHFRRSTQTHDAHVILLDFHKVIDGLGLSADEFLTKHRSELETILRQKAGL